MKEEWRLCKGFEPFYEVSNTGRVRSIAVWSDKYQRILTRKYPKEIQLEKTKDGYYRVLLCHYGKHYHCSVHRLVAIAFIDNPNNYPCINHKDENPSNNNVDNLEWCSYKYNNNYGTLPKRIKEWQTNSPVRSKAVSQIDKNGNIVNSYPSQKEAERQTGVSADMIGRVCRGEAKTGGGYKWVLI